MAGIHRWFCQGGGGLRVREELPRQFAEVAREYESGAASASASASASIPTYRYSTSDPPTHSGRPGRQPARWQRPCSSSSNNKTRLFDEIVLKSCAVKLNCLKVRTIELR